MPCYDPDTHDKPERLKKRIHKLTAMLCWLCGRSDQSLIGENADLAVWWKDHHAHDEIIASLKEKERIHGCKSLTPEEVNLLWEHDDIRY